jgi:hypothetical protein
MNRHERRKSKVKDVVLIDYGTINLQSRGADVDCYVCDAKHKMMKAASITANKSITVVPLCEKCFNLRKENSAIIRKFLNSPDLEVRDGVELSSEQIAALTDRQDTDATEH